MLRRTHRRAPTCVCAPTAAPPGPRRARRCANLAPRYKPAMRSPSVVIVSPALAAANNGNWQTAKRWASFLRPRGHVRITAQWPDAEAAGDELMIALHARRSASAIAAWTKPRGRLALVLT